MKQYEPRNVFLIIDHGPCDWLDDEGNAWLAQHPDQIELHRRPPYSPEFNPAEGVWQATRKLTTHKRFYHTVEERVAALVQTFEGFRREPSLIAGHVQRFQEAQKPSIPLTGGGVGGGQQRGRTSRACDHGKTTNGLGST